MIYAITPELESKSKFGIPYEKARIWYWHSNDGKVGWLRANTEMEALDRIDEVFERGRLRWITEKEYKQLTKNE